MQSDAQPSCARSAPAAEGERGQPRAPAPPRRPPRADDKQAERHDARYWEAVDRLEWIDPAG
jgi:hypothetical protein